MLERARPVAMAVLTHPPSSSSPTWLIFPLALITQFRLRRRSPLSLCLLLDESHHEMAIGVGDVTSLRLLDLDPDQQHQTDGDKTSEDGEHDMTVEGIEEMERRLRRGGMMIELGIVKGVSRPLSSLTSTSSSRPAEPVRWI